MILYSIIYKKGRLDKISHGPKETIDHDWTDARVSKRTCRHTYYIWGLDCVYPPLHTLQYKRLGWSAEKGSTHACAPLSVSISLSPSHLYLQVSAHPHGIYVSYHELIPLHAQRVSCAGKDGGRAAARSCARRQLRSHFRTSRGGYVGHETGRCNSCKRMAPSTIAILSRSPPLPPVFPSFAYEREHAARNTPRVRARRSGVA